jgi:hypothetical protein
MNQNVYHHDAATYDTEGMCTFCKANVIIHANHVGSLRGATKMPKDVAGDAWIAAKP